MSSVGLEPKTPPPKPRCLKALPLPMDDHPIGMQNQILAEIGQLYTTPKSTSTS
ncbi:hypothetical protein Hanom_Chr10g00883271 [Helianthus anomalus]